MSPARHGFSAGSVQRPHHQWMLQLSDDRQRLVSCGNVESVSNSTFAEQYSVIGLPLFHNSLHDIIAKYFQLQIHLHAKWLTSQLMAAVQHGSCTAYCRTKVTLAVCGLVILIHKSCYKVMHQKRPLGSWSLLILT